MDSPGPAVPGAFFASEVRHRGLPLACCAVAVLVLIGPWIAPHDPWHADILNRLAPPSLAYPLGTDAMGRDVLSRLLYGARLTTLSAGAVVAAAAFIGTAIGLTAGFVGGIFDRTAMRVTEGLSSLPALAISLVIAGTLGLGLDAVVTALVAVHWTEYARIVRNATMVECGKPYILAARAIGAGGGRIVLRHLLPNLAGPILVLCTYSLSWAILAFAGLSFLGLGVEPGVPEWGRMIAEARTHMRAYPRLVLAPGLTITGFILLTNMLGDALADRWRVERTRTQKKKGDRR